MKILLNTLMALCFLTTAAIACPPSGDGAKAEAQSEASVKLAKLNLNVVGMTCGGCENKVKAALGGIDGIVETHKVCSESDKASLTYDPEVTTEEEIIAALGEKTGYSITIITSAGMTEEAAKAGEAKKACASKSGEAAACCKGKSKAECAKAKAECSKSKADKASCDKAKASADKDLKEEK